MDTSSSVFLLLTIGLLVTAFVGLLLIKLYNRHICTMSESKHQEVNRHAELWGLIGILPTIGLVVASETIYDLSSKERLLLGGAILCLFALTGHLGALLQRNENASPTLLIVSLLLALLMPLFALPLAGYALSSPQNRVAGMALLIAGVVGVFGGLLFILL